MPSSNPTKLPRAVRQTLDWLRPEPLQPPALTEAAEEPLLRDARQLHESLCRLPGPASAEDRCLLVGSDGREAPYLRRKLGWRNIVCVRPPRDEGRPRRAPSRARSGEQAAYGFTVCEHDVEDGPLPFKDESFDLILVWGCIEHWRHDPEFVLYDLNRVSKPSAGLSLVTTNAISFEATHSLLLGHPIPLRMHWPTSEGPYRLYTPSEIASLLEGTGWRVDVLTTIVPDPPVYWKWWKRWLFRQFVGNLRRGFGLAEPFWDAYILAQAAKAHRPVRSFPAWLYKDPKVRQLRLDMLELLDGPQARRRRRGRQTA